MQLQEGGIYGIVGDNGSGKTVLLKLICGFMKPDSGTVTVNGKVIGKDADFPENTGIIIEAPGFLPNYSGMKNLEYLASIRGKIGKEQIEAAMKTVGLDPSSKLLVGKYSLGMKQRLGNVLHAYLGEKVALASLYRIHRLAQSVGNIIHRVTLGRQSQNISLCLAQGYAFFLFPLVAQGGIFKIATLTILLHDDMSRFIGCCQ